ncbi:exosome non-catalytic core subunit rrp40 [Onygenales sp. PD_12]|nr:exosome non-catalytic core subunit rrp40 [Onygenales sp. PD_12]
MPTTSLTPTLLLPGDPIRQQPQPPSNPPIKLSTGLRLLKTSPPTTSPPTPKQKQNQPPTPIIITPTKPGLLTTDTKRNTCTLTTFSHRRYTPTANDLVIAQIHHSSPDYFHCTLSPHTPHAFLAQLAFEGATRKTRPQLKAGEIVYARVLSTGVGAGGEVELTCVNPATGKAEPGGLGPLVGGMVFEVSTGLAERLMMKAGEGGVVVLEELGRRLEGMGGFEVAVGKNGRVWVDCSPVAGAGAGGPEVRVKVMVVIGRCLREVDENGLGVQEQKMVVGRVLREVGLER